MGHDPIKTGTCTYTRFARYFETPGMACLIFSEKNLLILEARQREATEFEVAKLLGRSLEKAGSCSMSSL